MTARAGTAATILRDLIRRGDPEDARFLQRFFKTGPAEYGEEAFLRTHYQAMPRTMLRYAIERLPERRRKQSLNGTV